jgi:hypothetical protein
MNFGPLPTTPLLMLVTLLVACVQVGHTIQDKGINGACDGRVLRVDVGLSAGCGNGEVQVRLLQQCSDTHISVM